MIGLGTHRDALPARELRRLVGDAPPLVLARAAKRALRRSDATKLAVGDRKVATHENLAFDLAVAEDLVVIVAFLVAVVDAAHRRVSPVDDAHAGLAVEEGASADQDLALSVFLLEDHPPEIRRERVDRAFHDLRAALGDLLEPLHLLDQGWDVLEAGLPNLVAQGDELGVVIDELASMRRPLCLNRPVHPREHALFLGDGRLHLRVCARWFRIWAPIELRLLHFPRIKDESRPGFANSGTSSTIRTRLQA